MNEKTDQPEKCTRDGFLDHPPEKLDWQKTFVQENDAQPLYIGWTEITGITANGDIVIWNTGFSAKSNDSMARIQC